MRIIKLELTNFQRFKEYTFAPNGNSVEVSGRNGSGKSTLANAFTWLLFHKAANNEKNYSPKPLDEQGKEAHGLDTSVKGYFLMDNGKELTLKKTLKEKWTKKRGSAERLFTGNTMEYEIDGLPATLKEHNKRISEICPESLLPLLTQIDYFADTIHWTERRKILNKLIGGVSESDVLESNPKLEELKKHLGNHTVENYEKVIKKKQTEINKRLEEIPNRIDEATRAMSEVSDLDEDEIKADLAKMESKVETLTKEMAEMNASEKANSIKQAISLLQLKISNDRYEYAEQSRESGKQYQDKIKDLIVVFNSYSNDITTIEREITETKLKFNRATEQRKILTDEYVKLRQSQWTGDTNCPYCKQGLPAGDIETHQREFNLKKSKRLEDIASEVQNKCSKEIIAELEAKIMEREEYLQKTKNRQTNIKEEMEEAKRAIEELKPVPYEETPLAAGNNYKMSELKADLDNVSAEVKQSQQMIQGEIKALKTKRESIYQKLSLLRLQETQEARIETLRTEERELAQEYANLERLRSLCDLYATAEVEFINTAVAGIFPTIKFSFYNEQINDGIEKTCEVLCLTDKGGYVPYKATNTASKVKAGLEIIDVISEHYGVSLPVFCDDINLVHDVPKYKTQVIELRVDKAAKDLTIKSKGE